MMQKHTEENPIYISLLKPVGSRFTKNMRSPIVPETNHEKNGLIGIKTLLEEILKTTEIIQLDVDFIKSRYTKSTNASKKRVTREQKISELKHRILMRGKKTI